MRALVFSLGLVACAAGSTPPPAEEPTPTPSARATVAAGDAPAPTPAPTATATPRAQPKKPAPQPVAVLAFEHARDQPVRSLALGIKRHAAVLEDEPWLFDGKTWTELKLPAALRTPEGASDAVHVFFGRDNRLRLMGTRTRGGEVGFVYLRYKHGWREGHREIGSLANKPHAGLFGILGHDDPEVVCKIGDLCIIKRLTGWTIIPSGPGSPPVVIAQKSAWALFADHIAEVGDKGWRRLPALPFQNPRGLWADGEKRLYVSAEDAMYHFDGATWKRHDAPVASPRAVWGTGPDDVWVAGEDGAGHFDGSSWRKVAGVEGPLSFVLGHDDAVWLAGASGVWRGSGPRLESAAAKP